MDDRINYSIIIPHRNIPLLLRRCLDSIPRRMDIQIIVVDDNSDPGQVDFEHFPGLDEPCVEVYFTKEGKGAGYARNIGLKHAKGKWLLFADADDFYKESLLLSLDPYIDATFDIVYFGADSVTSETLAFSDRSVVLNQVIDMYNTSDVHSVDLLKYTNWVPWNKMFKHDFVRKYCLSYEEIKTGNDAFFVVKAGWLAKNISVIKKKLYCVTYRTDSLTFSVSKESFFCSIDMRLRLNEFFQSIGKSDFRDPLYGAAYFAYSNFGFVVILDFLKQVKKHNQLLFLMKSLMRKIFSYAFAKK